MPQTDSPLPSSTPFSSDRQVSHSITSPSPTLNLQRKFSSASSVQNTPGSTSGPSALLSNADVEKECVRLYFQNLHLIHPILDQTDFIAQCETEIWARDLTVEGHRSAPTSKFLALFNAVLAIGAINAGDDAVFMRDMATIRQMERFAGSDQRAPAYPPLKLAKLFFERAKYNLGDVTEACSLENTQTLLLMTVFCQNALKPHSCYLYSGLAVRSALAIGLPNTEGLDAVQASMLWWNLYSFEIEMCASAGRESALREPEHYRLRLPHILVPEDPKQQFTSHMVALARIMAQLSDEIYKFNDQRSLREKSHECLDLDKQLVIWKSQLPLSLDFDQSSLVEPEWVSKQKIVLRNRFLNAKILLHRPFLIASANESDQALYTVHVHACVAASVDTIQSLYEMYKYRPYFRTWWYNTTYTLYASMILLYVVLTNTLAVDRQYAIQAVEKSLEIFNAMNMVGVARRCADITTEVLAMAKKSTIEGHGESSSASVPVAEGFVPPSLAPGAVENQFDFDLSAENPYASLVDPNIMDGFAEFQTGFFDMPDFNSVLMEGSFT
ncbi:hypothetical protein EJ08DRAFT_354842 [Tothia fuscella]|uniref:Xylanolytic transcriptional activator regulatory domain-containing protein n=1 Tax=Tothia fuscella TaxID=1048955 RepID=A0A9P4TWB6_9PEZI|nr:hypothetical protein EJ08DRAFT_354842 [Tothia fuscella]